MHAAPFFAQPRQATGRACLSEFRAPAAPGLASAWVPCFAYVYREPTLRSPTRDCFIVYARDGSSFGFSVSCSLALRRAFGVHVADNGLTAGFYSYLADRDGLLAAPAA